MNAASVKFFLFSLGIHFALFWLLWQKGSIEYEAALSKPGASATSVVWTARVVPKGNGSAVAIPHHAPVVTEQQPITELRVNAAATYPLAESDPETDSEHEYVLAGRLTRLPVPITKIDLNVDGINDSGVTGKIELTVLVNHDGTVAAAMPVVEMDSARAFAERVAQRFRLARFRPGEVDGKAVNAQLRITVVSEQSEKVDTQAEIDVQ